MNKKELIERIKGLENIFGNKTKYIQKDAVITDVEIGQQVDTSNGCVVGSHNKVTIYHNQNPIALAECYAEHNGYYYSVGSLVIGDIHFPVVDA